MKKTIVGMFGIVFLIGFFGSVGIAAADSLIEKTIIGLPVAGMEVRGVTGGGLAWEATGEAELKGDGELEVEVEGLLFAEGPPAGTTGPITAVDAVLTCAGVVGPVAVTSAAPLNSDGDAEIEEEISLPASCVGPVVLIRIAGGPAGVIGLWIAATGF